MDGPRPGAGETEGKNGGILMLHALAIKSISKRKMQHTTIEEAYFIS